MKYSQSRALWAITKASFKAIFSQPSSIFFSLLFPIVFILIFGAFGDKAPTPSKIAIDPSSDTLNALFDSISKSTSVTIVTYPDTASRNNDLRKGKLDAVVFIPKAGDSSLPRRVLLQSSEAGGGAVYRLMRSFDYLALKAELADAKLNREYQFVPEIVPGKKYRTIDFVLPGQLGFSVLFSTLFGIAFIFLISGSNWC